MSTFEEGSVKGMPPYWAPDADYIGQELNSGDSSSMRSGYATSDDETVDRRTGPESFPDADYDYAGPNISDGTSVRSLPESGYEVQDKTHRQLHLHHDPRRGSVRGGRVAWAPDADFVGSELSDSASVQSNDDTSFLNFDRPLEKAVFEFPVPWAPEVDFAGPEFSDASSYASVQPIDIDYVGSELSDTTSVPSDTQHYTDEDDSHERNMEDFVAKKTREFNEFVGVENPSGRPLKWGAASASLTPRSKWKEEHGGGWSNYDGEDDTLEEPVNGDQFSYNTGQYLYEYAQWECCNAVQGIHDIGTPGCSRRKVSLSLID